MLFVQAISTVSTLNNEFLFANLLQYRNRTRLHCIVIDFVNVVGSKTTSGTLKGTQNILFVLCHTVM